MGVGDGSIIGEVIGSGVGVGSIIGTVIGAVMGLFSTEVKAKVVDVDDSGQVDMTDVNLVQGAFGTYEGHPSFNSVYDLNGDGSISIGDIILVASAVGLNWPPSNLSEGQQFSFYVKGQDPEGQALTYSATELPGGACFNGKNADGASGACEARHFLWTPSSTQSGSYNLTFNVSDGDQTTSVSLPVTVLDTQ